MRRIKVVNWRWIIPVLMAVGLSWFGHSDTPPSVSKAGPAPRPTLLLLIERKDAQADGRPGLPCHGAPGQRYKIPNQSYHSSL